MNFLYGAGFADGAISLIRHHPLPAFLQDHSQKINQAKPTLTPEASPSNN